jgi:hypothetical protein
MDRSNKVFALATLLYAAQPRVGHRGRLGFLNVARPTRAMG